MRNAYPPIPGRAAYTLVELIISMGAATMLMAGMASAIFISSQSLGGVGVVEERRDAAEVQAAMLRDLAQANLFSTRTATTATFTVPDRDGDASDETLSYNWTGAPNYELQYAVNGGASVPLLSNVQNFNFDWNSRFITGGAGAPPPMDPNSWGNRWVAGGNFGYEDVFASQEFDRRRIHATRVTLDSDQTIVSITAYFTVSPLGSSDVGFALYGVDNNDNPKDLIVNTSKVKVTESGWVTLNVAPVSLTAGVYYLALSHRDDDVKFRYEETGGETHRMNYDPLKNNTPWASTFTSQSDNNRKLSIYATYQ